MYYNLWNIRKATSHYFLDCSSDQGTFIKVKWQLSFKCPSSYSTLKTSTASRIQTPTGGSALALLRGEVRLSATDENAGLLRGGLTPFPRNVERNVAEV
jgi:hypothetical protein